MQHAGTIADGREACASNMKHNLLGNAAWIKRFLRTLLKLIGTNDSQLTARGSLMQYAALLWCKRINCGRASSCGLFFWPLSR